MQYTHIEEGIFLSRPNRFVAEVEINGKRETVHVKNTGRCRELLLPGSRVYLSAAENPDRKTAFDLVAVQKGRRLINIDSQAPNKAAEEWLRSGGFSPGVTLLKPECRYGDSRFDFYGEREGEPPFFMEVKGVTLEENGVVYFPDAPTERGIKHIRELCRCLQAGYDAYLLFVIQMKDVRFFSPNDITHAAFGEALREAASEGVQLMARECYVTPDSMQIAGPVEIRL